MTKLEIAMEMARDIYRSRLEHTWNPSLGATLMSMDLKVSSKEDIISMLEEIRDIFNDGIEELKSEETN